MSTKKKRNRRSFFTPKRLTSMGCLLVIVLLVAVGGLLFSRIRSAFQNVNNGSGGNPGAEIQDIQVERGTVTDAVNVFGQIQPLRTETLAFRYASERILAVYAMPGTAVQKGDPLIELDRAALERNLATARDELQQAQDDLDKLNESDPLREFQLKADLAQAQADRDTAIRALSEFDAGRGTPQAKRAEAASALAEAKAALDALVNSESYQKQIESLQYIANIAEVEHGPYVLIQNPSEQDRDKEWLLRIDMLDRRQDLDSAKLAHDIEVRAAQQRVTQAQQALVKLDHEIALNSALVERIKLEVAVKLLDANIVGLENQLDTLDGQANPVEVAKAQARILKAEYAVQEAEVALTEATLVAPFDGTVTEVNAVPDTVAATGTKLVTLTDDSVLQVVARLGEVDIVQVEAGMPVTMTFDAFGPDTEVPGQLQEIPRYGKYENGMTLYDVAIGLKTDLPILQGMSANVRIPRGVKENVLLLPVAAIQYGPDGTYVLVVEGDKVTSQPVRLGVGDGIHVEIIEGLTEGQTVRMMLWGPYNGGVYMGG